MRIKGLQVGPIGTNCYIVEDEEAKRAAIIDPGEDAGAILSAVTQDDPEMEVACILLTHGHYDHTSAIPDLREALPEVPVFIHKADFVNKARPLFNLPEDLPNVHFYDEGDKVKALSLKIGVYLDFVEASVARDKAMGKAMEAESKLKALKAEYGKLEAQVQQLTAEEEILSKKLESGK